MKLMKFLKNSKIAVALVLALIFTLQLPMNAFASSDGASGGSVYVSDVYIAYGNSAEEASGTLEAKGFIPLDGNLNEYGDTYVMMGYKTTDNIRDSVTDIAVMNMDGGFSVEDYRNMINQQKNDIAQFLTEFMAVIKEYRANYQAKKNKAVLVHDLLNYYVDDDTGMKMGDLLNSETLQDRAGIMESVGAENPDNLPDLVTIIMQGNAAAVKQIENLLTIAADSDSKSWVDRFAESDYDDLLDKTQEERPELNTDTKLMQFLDNQYAVTAEGIGMACSELRAELLEYQASDMQLDNATEEQLNAAFGTADDASAVDTIETMKKKNAWLRTGIIYESLKEYDGGRFEKGGLLDFFLEESAYDDPERYYPLVAALSDGQVAGLPFVSFDKIVYYGFSSDDAWQSEALNSQESFSTLETVSVYFNVNREIFGEDGSVALTDAALRESNTNSHTQDGDPYAAQNEWLKYAKIGWVSTGVTLGVGMIIGGIANGIDHDAQLMAYEVAGEFKYIDTEYVRNGFGDEFQYYNYEWDISNSDAQQYIADHSAKISRYLSNAFYVACVALAVLSTVTTIIALCQRPEYELAAIPKYMVDVSNSDDGTTLQINYTAVQCNREEYFGTDYSKQSGNAADLNADEGKQWLALYVSKNSAAGRPVKPEFIVQSDTQAPGGMEGTIHMIGEKGAANLDKEEYRYYSTIGSALHSIKTSFAEDKPAYVFYGTSNFYKTYDESAGNMTASVVGSGTSVIFGAAGLVVGAAIGIIITNIVRKRKKTSEA